MDPSICLISLPSPFLIEDKVNPPLGLLYVAAALKTQKREQVTVYDGPIDSIPQGFDVYAISSTTPQFPMAKTVKDMLKKSNPKCRVMIGGPHATVDHESCIYSGFDSTVMGEGELGAGIAIDNMTKIVWGPPPPPILPDRDAIDLSSYKFKVNGIPATTMMTSRGCPYQCGFCCKTSGKVSLYPADFVNKEIELLHNCYGFNALMFFDDIFIMDKNRATSILPTLQKFGITWRGFARADLVVKHGIELAKMMKDSGCYEIGVGIESGCDTILQTINKGENSETILNGISILKEAGIRVKGFFIVGLPGENEKSLRDTEQFVAKSGLDDIDISLFQPYRGSPIFRNRQNYDIEWDHLDLEASWFKGTPGKYRSQVRTKAFSPEVLVEARDMLERKFKRWD